MVPAYMSYCPVGCFYRNNEWTALVPQRLLTAPATNGVVALTSDEGNPATGVGELLYLLRHTAAGTIYQVKGSE